MTQKEFEAKIAKIKAQEKEFGVKIDFDIIDKDHLNCLWYGGYVGSIEYPDGWKIIIEVNGDVDIAGFVDGEQFDSRDKNNSGAAFDDLAETFDVDDDKLAELETYDGEIDWDGDPSNSPNRIVYNNNNWVEFNFESPEGKFIDVGMTLDNILDNNVLDAFDDIADFEESLLWVKKNKF